MAKNKTQETQTKVLDFINSYVEDEQKKSDSLLLMALMSEWTGFEPKMWGPTIIGFGSYHYKYESGHEGDMPLLGFSPRKAAISLYVYSPSEESAPLLDHLGKFKMGKGCIYIKRIADIQIPVLETICKATITYLKEHHDCDSSAK